MRTRTFSDSIVSEASRYDLILATLPLPLFLGLVVGTFTDLPISPVVGLCGLGSVAVLGYGLFVAAPRSPTESTIGTALDAPFEAVDASLGPVDDSPRDDTGGHRRRRGV
ncbi:MULTISPECIES: hypothetical protein [Haloferax]|uniref:Uncharacterized protein n=1 Tax=Haloferax marinum TaxID=2666143 RepID=A0A6A8G8D3_9EURY|nr:MULTISPECIES: hypothetical protein [Haloferax]KAB1198067.1 hypothetical protein Hfx1150_11260 [Haloferax sp. CBA1150]MRW97137.1 hypothetical protein [Haloferax marinum]